MQLNPIREPLGVDNRKWLGVFSAHAEVVPFSSYTRGVQSSILRARGGSSSFQRSDDLTCLYSPRTRR